MVGYQGEGLSDVGRSALLFQQVKAIYYTLKEEYNLIYENSPISYPSGSQRMRLPAETMRSGSANCIDAAVLFASLLENVGFDPYVVLVPGHALSAWATWEDATTVQFLETTVIASASFEDACQKGKAVWDEYLAKGQFKLVSIEEARARGLTSIAKWIP